MFFFFLLLQFAVLLLSNLVCQGAIFAFLFLETKEVNSVYIQLTTLPHTRHVYNE